MRYALKGRWASVPSRTISSRLWFLHWPLGFLGLLAGVGAFEFSAIEFHITLLLETILFYGKCSNLAAVVLGR